MRIPKADPAVQQSFREVWDAIDKWSGGLNIDLRGRRIMNAGEPASDFDYVRLYDLKKTAREEAESATERVIEESALTLTGLHPGSVLWMGVGGKVAEDWQAFVWDRITKRLGVGTKLPLATLHVQTLGTTPLYVQSYGTTLTGMVGCRRARGTEAIPAAVAADDWLMAISGSGYAGVPPTGAFAEKVRILGLAAEAWTAAAQGTYIDFQTAVAGTTTLQTVWRMTDAGDLEARVPTAMIEWDTRCRIASTADGILRFTNNLATDFTRLCLGGTTSSFPALARSTTKLRAMLADGSAETEVMASAFTASSGPSAFAGTIRSTSVTATGAGAGAEMCFSTGSAVFMGYNRTTDAFLPVLIAGETITLGYDDSQDVTVLGNLTVDGTITPNATGTYTATNVTTDRAFDADTVAVAELADVVGTLIADLRAIGLVL